MALVNSVVTLVDFKKQLKIAKLDVFTSKAGNRYCVVDGNAVMLADGTNTKKPMFVISMVDKTTDEVWMFISNTKPEARKATEQI